VLLRYKIFVEQTFVQNGLILVQLHHRSSRLRIRSPETPGPRHAQRSAHEHR
jgi:hypothetical protein